MFLLTSPVGGGWLEATHQDSHRLLFVAVALLIGLHVALIVLLMAQRASRRLAEEAALAKEAALRASDGRARRLATRPPRRRAA